MRRHQSRPAPHCFHCPPIIAYAQLVKRLLFLFHRSFYACRRVSIIRRHEPVIAWWLPFITNCNWRRCMQFKFRTLLISETMFEFERHAYINAITYSVRQWQCCIRRVLLSYLRIYVYNYYTLSFRFLVVTSASLVSNYCSFIRLIPMHCCIMSIAYANLLFTITW